MYVGKCRAVTLMPHATLRVARWAAFIVLAFSSLAHGQSSSDKQSDLATYLLTLKEPLAADSGAAQTNGNFSVVEKPDRLLISLDGKSSAEFVFQDEKVLRPYFANVRLPSGMLVTRNHPPIEGVDANDHDTMHPGLWLGFGDIRLALLRVILR